MRRVLPAALALVLPTVVAAQRTKFAPSFEVSEVYDGNLFVSASDPQGSIVHRFGPRLEIDRRTAATSLVGRYEIDVEYLHALPQEGVQFARQLSSIDFRHRLDGRLAFEGEVAYLDTRSPLELSDPRAPLELGVGGAGGGAAAAGGGAGASTGAIAPPGVVTGFFDRGRVRARRLSLGPSVDYEFDRRTRGDVGYAFERGYISDSTTDAHVAQTGVAHRFTRADTGSGRLLLREFVFDGDTTSPSQVALFGWERRFARRTSASVAVGPRFRRAQAEGVEAAASLRQGVGDVELEAQYTRGETTSAGIPGSLETDAGALSATLSLDPSVSRLSVTRTLIHGTSLEADVVDTRAETAVQVHPWLSLGLSVAFTWQRLETTLAPGAAGAVPESGPERVFHDVVALTLVVAPPKPVEL